MDTKVRAYWAKFLEETGRDPSTSYLEVCTFGDSKELVDELTALVLSGKKRATASSLLAYSTTGEAAPKVGDYSVVTDWEGEAVCVIRTTQTQVLPFEELPFETVRREGEDDSLESWQEGHRAFFTREGDLLGYCFSPEMPVLFEDFEVVYP